MAVLRQQHGHQNDFDGIWCGLISVDLYTVACYNAGKGGVLMRNLTIKRAKRFVACLGKIQIYIEDAAGDLTISGRLCRKLGTVKNGEEKTFSITTEAVRIFAIADKVSKNYCMEYYQLEEGEEDILLTGKNVFNPICGNPFRFDDNHSEGIEAHRKQGRRHGRIVVAVALAVGLVVGGVVGTQIAAKKRAQDKTFHVQGMEITLNGAFREKEFYGYTKVFDSSKVAVFTLKENFDQMAGFENYSLAEYRDLIVRANALENCVLKEEDGLLSFAYVFSNAETNETYCYDTFVYKCSDGFWMIQFVTLEENAAAFEEQILSWAKSVKFTQ